MLGSTAAALLDEVRRGVPRNQRGAHYEKAAHEVVSLSRVLRNERLSQRERQIANNLRSELEQALPRDLQRDAMRRVARQIRREQQRRRRRQ